MQQPTQRKAISKVPFATAKSLAFGLLLASTTTAAWAQFTMDTIRIESDFIRATKNKDVIELRLKDGNLVVSKTPEHGFYGLNPDDRVVEVNGSSVHATQDFVDDLDKSRNDVASVRILRGQKTLTLSIPKKGYSIFL